MYVKLKLDDLHIAYLFHSFHFLEHFDGEIFFQYMFSVILIIVVIVYYHSTLCIIWLDQNIYRNDL